MSGNVTVGNTPGLYIGSGSVNVLNSAQSLNVLLANTASVGFYLSNANTKVSSTVLSSGVTPGTYGSDSEVAQVTVGADGRVTAVTTVAISGGGGSSYGNANVAAYLPTYTGSLDNSSTVIAIDANLGTATTNITALQSNAATQAVAINTLNANLGAFETYANLTFSTGGGGSYGNANVAAYLPTYTGSLANSSTIVAIDANLGTATTNITTLFSNAATQATAINTINANLGTATTNITTLFGNAATQSTAIATLDANLGTATTNITTLQSNAATQATAINTINANLGAFETYANATFGTSSFGNANVALYLPTYPGSLSNSSTIIAIDANLGTATTNITNLQSNAATQQTEINTNTSGLATLNANVGAFEIYANATFSTGSYGNTEVAAYLPTYTGSLNGNLTSGSVNSTGQVSITSATGQGVFVASGAGANVTVTADSYMDLTGTTGIVINNTPKVDINDGNLRVYKNSITPTTSGYIYADNTIQAGGSIVGTTFTYANGVNILSGISSSYGNTEVAAYLDGSVTTVKNTSGTLTLTGNTASLILSPGTVGGIGGPVVYAANSSNIASQAGIYSTNGYFWANGTAYSTSSGTSFSGNLAGNVLYDSVNERLFANAYPLSTPDATIPGNSFSGYVVNVPTYTSGVVQQPPLANATPGGTSIVGTSSQTVGLVQSSNIALQSGYGYGSQNRNTVGSTFLLSVTPTTANSMFGTDRVRGTTSILDYATKGISVGLMTSGSQNASTLTAGSALTYINGSGNIGSAVGGFNGVLITPSTSSTGNVQYATGTMSFINLLSTSGTSAKGNVVYARGFAPFVTGLSANLTVQNAVGLHTYSGWAGTGAWTAGSSISQNRYALLNEDVYTVIQTNGNVTMTGNTAVGTMVSYKEKQFAFGNATGTLTIDIANGPVQTMTATGDITINSISNIATGNSITLIITQDATGSRLLTSTMKFAGGSKTLSTAAGAIDIINIYYDGTNYLASLVKGYA